MEKLQGVQLVMSPFKQIYFLLHTLKLSNIKTKSRAEIPLVSGHSPNAHWCVISDYWPIPGFSHRATALRHQDLSVHTSQLAGYSYFFLLYFALPSCFTVHIPQILI